MAEEIIVQAQPRAWLAQSILQPYVGGYAASTSWAIFAQYAPGEGRLAEVRASGKS